MIAARRVAGLVAALLAAATVATSDGAEWSTIAPGTSTMDAVRTRYGAPTRTTTQKVEGYDTARWVYEGAQAPVGMIRMVVDFGLLRPGGYRREIVRTLRLEPKPGVFDRTTVLNGWGQPTRVGEQDSMPAFFYQEGLLVYFDREGWTAKELVFTPPQPAAGQGPPRTP